MRFFCQPFLPVRNKNFKVIFLQPSVFLGIKRTTTHDRKTLAFEFLLLRKYYPSSSETEDMTTVYAMND